ncbi:hypothetical protein BD309DRAFT_955088 [Dichomitus squalens]|nr:hypothetical protein BD309DRAFT_955088 [Dichomitus squalens]
MRLPSGEKRMNFTAAKVFLSVRIGLYVCASHRCSVPSLAPAFRNRPSGVYASEWIACPGRILICFLSLATAQMMTTSSCDADAKEMSSREKARAEIVSMWPASG